MAVDTGKHAESTPDQGATSHAELLLMRVLAQSAFAANGFYIEKCYNANGLFIVFAGADSIYGQRFPISCN